MAGRHADLTAPASASQICCEALWLLPELIWSRGYFSREAPVPYTYKLTTTLPASAREIYDAWLDSLAHSKMTGGEATMSGETGAEVSAWDGYITGRNVELVPGERIVQSWRTTQFTDEHGDSLITVTLEELENGTLLTLLHSNVPDAQTSYERGGWQTHYFEPMAAYFASRPRVGAGRKTKAAARKSKPARPAPRTRAKRAASKAKAAVGKKTPKRATAAKSKRTRAKKIKSRPARAKRK